MKKTRIFAVLAAMAMGLAVFGCSNGDSDSSESGSTGGTTSGSIEPVAENFIKIPAASIASFCMSDHEVTRGEYKAVMGIDPSEAKAYDKDGNELTGDDNVKNNPVNNVSWYDALVYCNTRSIKEGLAPCYAIDGKTDPKDWGSVPDWGVDDTEYEKWDAATCDFTADGYRLPTDAEWKWAACGGEDYFYAGSYDIDEVAWYGTNGTRDVKTKKANTYGLYDMSGNVWEWCWDWYDVDMGRCKRGGSWHDYNSNSALVANQSYSIPHFRFSDYGFRLVRNAN